MSQPRTRTREGVAIPSHPLVPATRRSDDALELRRAARRLLHAGDDHGARVALRRAADASLDAHDPPHAVEALLELGEILCSTQAYDAGLMVLAEAIGVADAADDPDLRFAAADSYERASRAARA